MARSRQGESQTGVIKASSEEEALETLQRKGLVVIKLRSAAKMSLAFKQIEILNRVKKKDVYVFFRQLSILVDANVPIVQSLRALSQQADNVYFKEMIYNISNDVDGGSILSKALAKYPKIFSNFSVNLIKAGEVSGQLSESLNYLADYLEKQYYLSTKVRGAMFYPAFILFVFVVVGIIVIVVVMPNLTSILLESGQKLPWTTKVIIAISNFIRGWWWILLIGFFGGVIAFFQAVKTKLGRQIWDKTKLKLPIFGGIFVKAYLSQFADSLSALVKGGVPIINALDVAGQVTNNVIYRQIIFAARDEVKVGKSLSSVLERYSEFTPLFVQMARTGERTGKLESILNKLSAFYNKEVDSVVDNLSKLLEPILLIFLACGVAVLVMAVFMPIYNMVGAM